MIVKTERRENAALPPRPIEIGVSAPRYTMKMKLAIEPVPLARARIAKGGAYLPERSKAFKRQLQQAAAQMSTDIFQGPVSLSVHFYRNIKPESRRFGDVDNHVKAVLDAFNGVVFTDDAQVVELHAYKHRGAPLIDLEVKADVD